MWFARQKQLCLLLCPTVIDAQQLNFKCMELNSYEKATLWNWKGKFLIWQYPMEHGSEFSEEQNNHYGLTRRFVPESNSELG